MGLAISVENYYLVLKGFNMLQIRTDSSLMNDRKQIMEQITQFWDKTSIAWRTIWGPHLHHGFYEENVILTPEEAQEKLLEKILEVIKINSSMKILDVGCGMGGSSLYLAKKFGSDITGITLSKKQLSIATQQALEDRVKNVKFEIEDALTLSKFADNSFDIVWSLESCEQFYDKDLFLKQAFRVLKPNGQLMLATWCSDQEEYQGKMASYYQELCYAFDLPYMPTIEAYQRSLEKAHFNIDQVLNWTSHVKQSWEVGLSLINAYSFFKLLKMTGWRAFRAVSQLKMMRDAFQRNQIQYGVFLATKP